MWRAPVLMLVAPPPAVPPSLLSLSLRRRCYACVQVLEIYELFRDLATLVDLQQESLDVIENRIIKAKNYTEKAEVELNEAEEYQKKARAVGGSLHCCCC